MFLTRIHTLFTPQIYYQGSTPLLSLCGVHKPSLVISVSKQTKTCRQTPVLSFSGSSILNKNSIPPHPASHKDSERKVKKLPSTNNIKTPREQAGIRSSRPKKHSISRTCQVSQRGPNHSVIQPPRETGDRPCRPYPRMARRAPCLSCPF